MRIQINGDEIKLYGPIWEGDGGYISNELEKLEGKDTLKVRLHTPGGSVIDGNLIANTLKSLNRPIHIIVDGLAASMGAVLLAYADKVSIRKNAFIMIHEPKGGVHGTADDLRSVASVLESMRNNFIDVFVSRTKKAKEDVVKWMTGDNWFDALKAKAEGLADIIEDAVIPDKELKALRQMKITADLKNFEKLSASFDFDITDKNNQNTNLKSSIKMKNELITLLGLTGLSAESSDSAVLAAVKAQIEAKDKKITSLEERIANIEKAEKVRKEKAIKAMLDKAVKEGKITAEEKETYQFIGKTNGIETLQTVLDKLAVRQTITGKVNIPSNGGSVTGIPQGRENWDWDKWQKEDSKGLEALQAENFEAFNNLFKGKFGHDFK